MLVRLLCVASGRRGPRVFDEDRGRAYTTGYIQGLARAVWQLG
jgi:hypothetical protein